MNPFKPGDFVRVNKSLPLSGRQMGLKVGQLCIVGSVSLIGVRVTGQSRPLSYDRFDPVDPLVAAVELARMAEAGRLRFKRKKA